MTFDMNALMKQAQEMQAQMQQMQEEAVKETAEASAGGGMVTVVATAGGEIEELQIDPKAIDPEDPEMLADLVWPPRTRHCARARAARGQDEAHAAARPWRFRCLVSRRYDRRIVLREAARRRQRGACRRGPCLDDGDPVTSTLFLVLQAVRLSRRRSRTTSVEPDRSSPSGRSSTAARSSASRRRPRRG